MEITASSSCVVTEFFKYDATTMCCLCSTSRQHRAYRTKLLVKALLKTILLFRGMALPRQSHPLVIPLLAHSCKQAVKGFLRREVQHQKEHLVPFHLPSTQVVAGKHASIKDVLYNHLRLQRSWSWTTPPQCHCGRLHLHHPELRVVQGHVASPVRLPSVSRRLRHILGFSAATQVSPSLQHYISTTSSTVKQWMVRNGLNNYDPQAWHHFVASQWNLHSQFAWTTVKKRDLVYLRQLQGFVIHGRDHAINEIFIFCPYINWKVVKATFGDQQVYRSITLSPMQTQQYLLQQSRQGWLRFYFWGRTSSSSSSLPIAYILLKKRKTSKQHDRLSVTNISSLPSSFVPQL